MGTNAFSLSPTGLVSAATLGTLAADTYATLLSHAHLQIQC